MPGSVLPDPGTGNLPKFDYAKKKERKLAGVLTSAHKLKSNSNNPQGTKI